MSDESDTTEQELFDDDLTIGEDEFGKFWKKKGVTVRRERNGHVWNCSRAKTDDYITALVANGIELRLNVMSDRVETCGNPISDINESVILNRLFDCDLRSEPRMRRAMDEAASRNKYHPIREFLESLTWDGKDHFAAFMEKIDMADQVGRVFFRKYMIGSIGKALDGAQNFMLVLVAVQGIGKSRLARKMSPIDKLFYEGPIRPDDKDSVIRLLTNWHWEVAELDATTRKSDRAALKHIISTKEVKIRFPYGRHDVEKTAASSFIGTVNPDGTGFLNDPSGSRRFAIVEINDIDWSYETDIDFDQVWAQMYAAYKAGESFELTKEEQDAQSKINEVHTSRAMIDDVLNANFKFDKDRDDWFITTSQIVGMLENMGLRSQQYRIGNDLAQAMSKRGLRRDRRTVDGKRQYGYVGILVDVSTAFVKDSLDL